MRPPLRANMAKATFIPVGFPEEYAKFLAAASYYGVFCPTPREGIFQRFYEPNARGSTLDGQNQNDYMCLKSFVLHRLWLNITLDHDMMRKAGIR
jgi:hypothetical protein